ncbi:MAG: type II toxin-antitoxin system Phd/YefM family antitoxin, partial [Desulfocapsaceae bacterium]
DYLLDKLDKFANRLDDRVKNRWQLQDAKNRFSNLVKKAQNAGPQIVTKRGKEAVVVMSVEDYKKLTKPETGLVDFFRNSPYTEEEIDISRSKEVPRDFQL